MEELIKQFTLNIQNENFSFLLIVISFLGGLIASLSPCTLAILPIIAGYVGGYDKKRNPLLTFVQMLFFVLGLSIVLTAIGIFCALTGKVFMAFGGNYWVLFMASLIMIFGLNLLGVIEIPAFVLVKKMPEADDALNRSNFAYSSFLYPLILGFFFALAATPCSTPILAAIMSFATLTRNIFYAACLLLAFSLGQGVIIILTGVFTSAVKNLRWFNKYSEFALKFCGILLILSSLYIFYKVFSVFIQ